LQHLIDAGMKINDCPMCGSKKLKVVSGKMVFQTPQGNVAIPRVTRQRCESCGEQFFDHESNKVLEQYRGRALQQKMKYA
jgi:YgiT-type zinc finger domain-containing protein